MAAATTSRRALLGTVAAIGAATAIPAAAAIAKATPDISPGLAALIEEHRAADGALDLFYAIEFNPAVEAHWDAVRRHEAAIEAVPHVEETGGRSIGGAPVTFSSRKGYSRTQAEHYIACDQREPDRGGDWNETIDAARRFIRADDERNERIRAIGLEPPSDAALAQREATACAPVEAARQAVHAFACNSLLDLQAKLAFIESNCGMDGEDLMPLVRADVEHLLRRRTA